MRKIFWGRFPARRIAGDGGGAKKELLFLQRSSWSVSCSAGGYVFFGLTLSRKELSFRKPDSFLSYDGFFLLVHGSFLREIRNQGLVKSEWNIGFFRRRLCRAKTRQLPKSSEVSSWGSILCWKSDSFFDSLSEKLPFQNLPGLAKLN